MEVENVGNIPKTKMVGDYFKFKALGDSSEMKSKIKIRIESKYDPMKEIIKRIPVINY
jgi:hypothetical protein